MFDEAWAVAAVDPHLADGGMAGGDLVQEAGAGGGVLHARRGDQHCDQQAERVGGDAAFASDDLLPGVDALTGGGDTGGGLDARRVDHASRRLAVPPCLLPQQLSEQARELGEYSLVRPLGEVAVDRVPGREVVREVAPLDAEMRSTYRIASMMSRRSCPGGRPKCRALVRRSRRQVARTGSINSQRASDRSLGYGRRVGSLPAYRSSRVRPGAQQRRRKHAGQEDRTFWDETETSLTPSSCHPTRPAGTGVHLPSHNRHDTASLEPSHGGASLMKTTT